MGRGIDGCIGALERRQKLLVYRRGAGEIVLTQSIYFNLYTTEGNIVADIIYIREERIKQDLKEAELALFEVRNLRAMGVDVPDEVFEEIEMLIASLEAMLVPDD